MRSKWKLAGGWRAEKASANMGPVWLVQPLPFCSQLYGRCSGTLKKQRSAWEGRMVKGDSARFHRHLLASEPTRPFVMWGKSYLLQFNPYTGAHHYLQSLPLSVQFNSVTQSCPTFCNPMNCSTSGLPVHHQLPEFTQTHVH